MALLNRLAPAALLVLVAGCDPTRPEVPLERLRSRTSVHAVLEAGTDTARVLVARYDPLRRETVRVAGARVVLTRGSEAYPLVEAPAGFGDCVRFSTDTLPQPIQPGCYAATIAGGIRAGERWYLEVALPDGTAARGATTIPNVPVVASPAPNTRVRVAATPNSAAPLQPFLIRWSTPDAGGYAQAALALDATYRAGAPITSARCQIDQSRGAVPWDVVPRDSLRLYFHDLVCTASGNSIPWDSARATLRVTAYDTAYLRYQNTTLRDDASPANRASAGISGAVGVFGGAASAVRAVTLLPAP